MDFYQIQYLINKYFFVFTFFNISIILSILYFVKLNRKIFYTGYFFVLFFSMYNLFIEILPNLNSTGWDKKAICGWIDLSKIDSK